VALIFPSAPLPAWEAWFAGYTLTQGISFGGAVHYPPVIRRDLHHGHRLHGCWRTQRMAGSQGWSSTFIATLGTLYIARGAALLISNGKTFPNLAGHAEQGNRLSGCRAELLSRSPYTRLDDDCVVCLCLGRSSQNALRRHVYAVGGMSVLHGWLASVYPESS